MLHRAIFDLKPLEYYAQYVKAEDKNILWPILLKWVNFNPGVKKSNYSYHKVGVEMT